MSTYTVKPVLSGHSKRRPKWGFKTDYRLMQVKSIAECSKLSFVFKIFVLSISERAFKTVFTIDRYLSCQNILMRNLFISAALLLHLEDKLKVEPKFQRNGLPSYHWAKQATNFNDKSETAYNNGRYPLRPNKKIPVFRVTRPYLNLLVKPRIFFQVF